MYLHQFIFTGPNLEPRVILAPCKRYGRLNNSYLATIQVTRSQNDPGLEIKTD